MGNFIFGCIVVLAFGVILYLYVKALRDAEIAKRTGVLNALKEKLDVNDPNYRRAVDDYNDFVRSNASTLAKYGIDTSLIVRPSVPSDGSAPRFASQLPNPNPR
jgi:hypothetical protein